MTGVDARMKWWDKVESTTKPNSYKVLLSTTDTLPASFTVELGDFVCTNTAWTEHTINLDAYTGEIVYIAFYQYASAATNYGFGIDDVLLEEIPTSPTFAYTPTSLAFDNTIQNTSSDWQNVTVSNIGSGTLDFDASDLSLTGTNASDFEFDASNLPAALTTGQSITIPVRFNAPGIGSYSATLRMTYNAVDYDVTLTGTGVVPYVNMTDGSTSLAAGETWNFYDSGGVSGQYGSSENFTYTFNPPAGYRCIVNFSAFNTESGYDFLKLYDGSDATGTQIGNYSGTTIPASYTSILSGSLTFVFTSDSGVQYSGWDATISSEELPSSPILSYSPAQLYFPFTAVGESSLAQNVTITNIGGGSLDLTAANFSFSGTDAAHYSFAADNLPASLAASESVEIPVYFEPASRGEKYDAFLDITYGSKALHQVALGAYAYPDTYLTEGFEGSFPPAGWANPGSWSKSAYTYYEGTGSAYKYSSSSSPYILSTPKLDLNSGDVLSFMGRVSSTSATLDIIYSQNGTDWTVLETLSAPTANTWLPVSVDLSPILSAKAGEGYYLGFRTMSSASYYIDNVVMPPFIQEAPEVVTLTAPVDSATNVGTLPTFTWTASATGGVPTGYNIYLDDVDGSTLYASDVSSPYTLETPLAYNTPYYWTVEAYNGILVGPKATVQTFTTMDDPTVTPPFTEGFEAGNTHNTAIVGWTQETVSGTNVWTANTSYTDYNRTPRTDSWNAFLRWGSTRWMFKPVNVTAETTYRVVVYARQDGATAANASIGISYGATDNAAAMTNVILASTGIINGDYQRLEGTFTPDATGVRYIGILGTINSSPYYISIDDITIAEVSDTPTFAISPTEKDYGTVNLGTSASQIFTISNSGGGTLTIEKEAITLTGDNTSEFNLSPIAEDISLTTSQTAQITVTFSPNSVGAKTAYLQIVDNTAEEKTGMKSGSKATHNIALNGTGFDATIHDFPFSESFETQFPPENWTNSDWEWSLYGDFHTGEEWAYCNLSGASLDTPPFALPEASELEFSFWYRAEGDGHPQDMNVLMSVDGTPQGSPIISISEATNTTYQKAAFDLASYAGHNVAFSFVGLSGTGGYSWGICVDDVAVKAYDYPAGTPVIIGDDTVTVTGGSANNVPGGDIPEIPNTAFVPVGSFVLQLVGAGPWTVTIETDALWGAYYQGGEWHEVQASEGVISFVVTASKDAEVPIVLGDLDPTLSVTLATFTAVLTADLHVQIAWMSESETDHAGYNLLRSEVQELSTAMRINDTMINEGIATGTQMSYIYTDTQVYHDATYYYWLESVSLSGETEYYGPITVYVNANGEGPGIPEIPLETKLYSAFPNPFNPSTNLRYSMKEAGDVRIDVYNLKGQILKTFHNSHNLPGYYQVNWDGRDMNGRVVGTGVYFYRMTSGQYSATRKMVLAK
ncbi:MAG: choice-of-anchor D domain-containing protein [Candidatus Cloacimonetes bacterium]|nr:choice-of-anchor D domain-containing protein [Candidatus Cloacimonadota bacterium]